ncbi:MAG: hypothetical protein RR967_02180 [Anaerovoracaceae bacterium]
MTGVGDVLVYVMCSIAGCFFSVMFFTIIENVSAGFRKIVDGYYRSVPEKSRKAIVVGVILLSLILVYMYVPIGITRGGILAGAIFGIPIYFKSGVTMGKDFYMNPQYNRATKAERQQMKQARKEKAEAEAEAAKNKTIVPKLKDKGKGDK